MRGNPGSHSRRAIDSGLAHRRRDTQTLVGSETPVPAIRPPDAARPCRSTARTGLAITAIPYIERESAIGPPKTGGQAASQQDPCKHGLCRVPRVAKAKATSWVLSPISAMNTKKRAIKKGGIRLPPPSLWGGGRRPSRPPHDRFAQSRSREGVFPLFAPAQLEPTRGCGPRAPTRTRSSTTCQSTLAKKASIYCGRSAGL